MFIKSSTCHMTFVQIGEFDWLSERQKWSIFIKMFKNLLGNHKEDEVVIISFCCLTGDI